MSCYIISHFRAGNSIIESRSDVLGAYTLIGAIVQYDLYRGIGQLTKIELEIPGAGKRVVWDINWTKG